MIRHDDPQYQPDPSLLQALERKPAVAVPQSFAARIAAEAAALPPAALAANQLRAPLQARRLSISRAMALAALVLLAAALFVVAPTAAAAVPSWGFALEMLLLAQLAAVGYGLVRMQAAGL